MFKKKTHIIVDVGVDVENKKVQFPQRYVSEKGIFYLADKSKAPFLSIGMQLVFSIYFTEIPPIHIEGIITLQISKGGIFWNVDFINLKSEEIIKIMSLIENGGITPPWERRSPRIPSIEEIRNIPISSTIYHGPNLIIGDLKNISLGGVLIETETPISLTVEYGEIIDVLLQPRTEYASIAFKGKIIRINQMRSEKSNNIKVFFGIQFISFDPLNKEIYLDTIKKICNEIKKKNL